MSIDRFSSRAEGVEPKRRQADERQALDTVHADPRPDQFEEARHDVDLQVELPARADGGKDRVVGLVGEGDDDALDIEQPDEVWKLIR